MGFKRVEAGYGSYQDIPILSVYSSGVVRFNSTATEKWLGDVDSVTFYIDEEESRIGVARGDGDYSLRTQEDRVGAEAYGMQALKQLGVDPDDIESSVQLELEHDPAEGLLVADATPLLEEVGDDGS